MEGELSSIVLLGWMVEVDYLLYHKDYSHMEWMETELK